MAPPLAAGAQTRAADIKMLNQRRWQEHVRAQQQGRGTTGAAPPAMPMPTAGALFNRPNPVAYNHNDQNKEHTVNPYNRERDEFLPLRGERWAIRPDGSYKRTIEEKDEVLLDELTWKRNAGRWQYEKMRVKNPDGSYERDANGDFKLTKRPSQHNKYMPVYGVDWTSVNHASIRKYRIPNTSVVNKVGDWRVPCVCWGVRMTAAQWIWWTNLICFVAHTFMVFLTFHMAYWRWDRSMFNHEDTQHMIVTIWRVSQIPTPYMLENNMSAWSPGWNLTNPRGTGLNEMYLHDNGLAVNFASLTAAFFATSAVFHLWALVVGLFERWWFIYWRQMDDAFCWWRWAEYSISASLMAMAISISIGLREQSILAGIFMLHWSTMAFGFLVEYISVPKYMIDTTPHWRPVGWYEFQQWKQNKPPPTPIERYRNDPRALKLISQDQWNMDRPLYDVQNTDTIVASEADLYVRQQREQNYLRRMVPHILGWFPMVAAWVIIVTHLEWARHDLSLVTERTIPGWVDGAIYGTVIIFWSFTVVQIIFQYLPPGFYWGSELIYCVLSLSAKLYLGFFLLMNVILTDGTVEQALAPTEGGTQ